MKVIMRPWWTMRSIAAAAMSSLPKTCCQRSLEGSPKRSSKCSPNEKDWMSNNLDQPAQNRVPLGQGLSIWKIAEEFAREKTVERARASELPPEFSPRPDRPTSFDAYKPAVRAQLSESPRLNAKVIAQRAGWK